jgi:TonB family protein
VPGDFSLADGGPDGEPRRKRSKLPLFVGVLVLLLVGAVYYYSNESQKAEAARLAFEQQRAAERLRLEQGKARLAEQKAQQEAEARKLSEMESAQKVAAAETARQQAEAARRQAEAEATSQAEAARLANARGTLVVTTIPAGANVTVGNLPPRSSPATFSDLRIGKYPVVITLSRHEDVKLELEVTDNGTTESGTINLVSFAGAIELASEPADVDYEIYPVNTAIVSMDAQHTGKTPARIEDLDPGDYSVTFSRPGWTPHTETVAVVRNATAHVGWKFPTGTVKITSSPAGATVNSNGTKLGVTPLTATQGTGPVRFELSLVGFDPVDLAGSVDNGKVLELSTLLHETDRPFGPGELDQLPQAISQKAPSLPDSLTLVDGRVVIQMTINRDGTPTDIKIVRTSNPEIGKIYLAAAAKWKFKPGMAGGRPVRSTVVLPILISAARF